MTTIQVISDLYLEYYNKIPDFLNEDFVKSEILICAGDIGCPFINERFSDNNIWCDFIDWASKSYKKVFYVMGNSESYFNRYYRVKRFIKDYLSLKENCTFLERGIEAIIDEKYKIIGCTLWSDVPDFAFDVSGDSCIMKDDGSKHTRQDIQNYNKLDIKWLEEKLLDTENTLPIIVVTHHLPSFRLLPHKFISSPVAPSVANHLDELMPYARTWIFGHSHSCTDEFINGVRCISNSRGYVKEKTGFSICSYFI